MRKLTPAYLEPPQGRLTRVRSSCPVRLPPQKRRNSPRDPPLPAGWEQSPHCRMPDLLQIDDPLGPQQPELANADHGQCRPPTRDTQATRPEPFVQQAVKDQYRRLGRPRRPRPHPTCARWWPFIGNAAGALIAMHLLVGAAFVKGSPPPSGRGNVPDRRRARSDCAMAARLGMVPAWQGWAGSCWRSRRCSSGSGWRCWSRGPGPGRPPAASMRGRSGCPGWWSRMYGSVPAPARPGDQVQVATFVVGLASAR
jgi:hypothetical protein